MGFRKPLTINRVAGAYDHGKWVEGDTIDFEIQASVQPVKSLSENEMQSIPEGRRQSAMFRIYTNTELLTTEIDQQPDRAMINGEEFELFVSNPWQNNVINHYKYVLVKMEKQN